MPPTSAAFDLPFSAVLLDMDGTLIDSIPAVERSWLRWCGEFDVDPHLLAGLHGVTAANVIEQLLPAERREEALARIRQIDLAEARIAATGLPHPPVVVTASDVVRGKPWPDPWLEGARLLGVDPGDCLVVEDSVAGLSAAREAGCRGLVAVLSTTPREALSPVSDLVVEDLAALEVDVSEGMARVRPMPGAPVGVRA